MFSSWRTHSSYNSRLIHSLEACSSSVRLLIDTCPGFIRQKCNFNYNTGKLRKHLYSSGLTCTVTFPSSWVRLRVSLYAIIRPLSIRSLKLQTLMSTWVGTNCSTVWTWYLRSGIVYSGDTMGMGPKLRGGWRRALMTEIAVKINGPDTTRKAKLDGVLRN